MISRRHSTIASLLSLVTTFIVVLTAGCGSGQEAQIDALSIENSRMRYQMDSLLSENHRYVQQLDALASENRVLTARISDAEARSRMAETPAPAPVPPPPPKDMNSAYAGALETYRARNFSGAMLKFEQMLKQGVGDDLADNCHYWIGECLYGMGKYNDAMQHFETVINFPGSEKKDDSALMMGNCNALLGNRAAAKEWYNRVITAYPGSPFVKKAQDKLARMG